MVLARAGRRWGGGHAEKKIIRATIRVASQSEEEGAEIKEIGTSEWRQGLQAHTMPQTNGTSRAPEEKGELGKIEQSSSRNVPERSRSEMIRDARAGAGGGNRGCMDGKRKENKEGWASSPCIHHHTVSKGFSLCFPLCAPLPGRLVNGYRYSDLYVRSTLLRPCDHRFRIFGYLQKGNRRMGTSGSLPLSPSLTKGEKKKPRLTVASRGRPWATTQNSGRQLM